jgi:hypothetical protein
VLATLGDHLTGPVARRLAEGLPEPLALPLLRAGELAQGGGLDEFYAMVEEPSGLRDSGGAVGPVLRALAEYGDPQAVRAAREQLPEELAALLPTDADEAPASHATAARPPS